MADARRTGGRTWGAPECSGQPTLYIAMFDPCHHSCRRNRRQLAACLLSVARRRETASGWPTQHLVVGGKRIAAVSRAVEQHLQGRQRATAAFTTRGTAGQRESAAAPFCSCGEGQGPHRGH